MKINFVDAFPSNENMEVDNIYINRTYPCLYIESNTIFDSTFDFEKCLKDYFNKSDRKNNDFEASLISNDNYHKQSNDIITAIRLKQEGFSEEFISKLMGLDKLERNNEKE